MNRPRVLAGLLSLTLLAAGGDLWITRASAQAQHLPATRPANAIVDPRLFDDYLRDIDVVPPKVDVLGNEVDDAVGDYRVDVQGSIYERHSPETEVGRLRPAVG